MHATYVHYGQRPQLIELLMFGPYCLGPLTRIGFSDNLRAPLKSTFKIGSSWLACTHRVDAH